MSKYPQWMARCNAVWPEKYVHFDHLFESKCLIHIFNVFTYHNDYRQNLHRHPTIITTNILLNFEVKHDSWKSVFISHFMEIDFNWKLTLLINHSTIAYLFVVVAVCNAVWPYRTNNEENLSESEMKNEQNWTHTHLMIENMWKIFARFCNECGNFCIGYCSFH